MNDVVKLVNGTYMSIAHVCHANYTLPCTNNIIYLNQLLHVLDMTKKLLSVSNLLRITMYTLCFTLTLILLKLKTLRKLYYKKNLRKVYVFFHFSSKYQLFCI